MSNQKNINRRSLLRSIGGMSAGILLMSGTVSAKESPTTEQLNLAFDPENEDETKSFVKETFDWAERTNNQTPQQAEERVSKARLNILNSLDKDQKRAVSRILDTGINFTIEARTANQTAGTLGGCSNHEYEFTAKIDVPVLGTTRYDAFDFTHDFHWCASGGEMTSVRPRSSGKGRSYVFVYWTYDGITGDESFVENHGTHAISMRTGQFQRCVFVNTSFTCVRTDFAFSELWGYPQGHGFTADYGTY